MSCSSCERQKPVNLASVPDGASLLGVTNIQVIEGNEVHRIAHEDWPPDKHKLLIFVPEAFTPVCASELGAMNAWHEHFQGLGCELIAACVDSPARLLDWFNTEELIADPRYR